MHLNTYSIELKVGDNMKKDLNLTLSMIKIDFKNRFAITGLGSIWGFITPIIYILIYAYVFQYILKINQNTDIPYAVWFIPGIVIWTFISEAIIQASNSIREYSYLIKKTKFPISILPTVKISSSLIVNIILMLITIIITTVYGYFPNLLGLIYYIICAYSLIYAITKLTSALVVMFGDVSQALNIILQIFFWLTPVIWNISILENSILLTITKYNPFAYVICGIRSIFTSNSFLVFEDAKYSLFFWILVLLIYLYGKYVFDKNKKYFIDVL